MASSRGSRRSQWRAAAAGPARFLPLLPAVLWVTVKRIASNWRIAAALLLGLAAATGLAAAIPTFAAGSLQRSFLTEWLSRSTFRPPFALIVSHRNERTEQPVSSGQLARMHSAMDRALRRRIGEPITPPALFTSLGTNPATAGGLHS